MATDDNDGVNRTGLDYRAGWCEALRAMATNLNIANVRAKQKERPGLELAMQLVKESYDAMIAKMKGQ